MPILKGKIHVNDGNFVDEQGRTVQLKGINLDGGCKYPRTPFYPSHVPVDRNERLFFDGDHVSFVNRPFPLKDAVGHLNRIKRLGYNTLRYVITWEAIEHEGPGKYDEGFIDYTIELFKIIEQVGGLYIFVDPHQDVWSRYSGGDGAPLWTLYAAGMNPHNFDATQAAILQNYFPHDPDAYPKMLWTTNINRLATATMFVLFFAGKTFAPKCVIDGVNIQDYLQSHFIDAFAHFVSRVKQSAPHLFDKVILGVETVNEPSPGFIGVENISEIPPKQKLKLGTCPTVLQSVRLGMGIPTEVDEYKISVFGPRKIGTAYIDPDGATAWLDDSAFDEHYGFKRDSKWELGKCIWAQHGVWDVESATPLINDYFGVHPQTGEIINEEYFINHFFVDHYLKFRKAIRNIIPDTIIFLQPPPLHIPPKLKGTSMIDDNTVFCAHYYDGMTLMFKTWNTKYNVDTYGIMRDRYSNPVFGIVFGEANIRKSFRKQLSEMAQESKDNLGPKIPVIFSEIGSPFDMDNKKSFENDDFSAQTSSLDALGYALEGSNLSHTWWNYTSDNCHKWGDRFNCEDFSFWSVDDDMDDETLPGSRSSMALADGIPGSSDSETLASSSTGSHVALHEAKGNTLVQAKSIISLNNTNNAVSGLRAVDAIIRPYCLALNGEFIDAVFDLKKLKYTLTLVGDSSSTTIPTRIFFPEWHFDSDAKVILTAGTYEFNEEGDILEWYHGSGRQSIEITSIESEDYLVKTRPSCVDSFLSFFC